MFSPAASSIAHSPPREELLIVVDQESPLGF